MADNYLENQYERYLARKAAWEKSKRFKKKTISKKVSETSQKEITPSPAHKPDNDFEE